MSKMQKKVNLTKEDKNPSGGLSAKGRAKYNRATGGNLQAPVTESNPTGKKAERKKSFCSRSLGQKNLYQIDCKENPKKRLCLARKKWNCA